MRNDPKLKNWLDIMLDRAALASARKIAKQLAAGAEGFSLSSDPVSQFIMAHTSQASRERAFNVIFPAIQGYIMGQAAKRVAALKSAGKAADAKILASVFSKTRLNRDTMRATLSSQAMAEHYFPTLVNRNAEPGQEGKIWDDMLTRFAAYAPKHKRKVLRKDASGNTVKRLDESGNEVSVYDMIPAPQDPSIFLQWRDTRYEVAAEVQEDADLTIEFGEMDMGE
jgi:hypothetical protein